VRYSTGLPITSISLEMNGDSYRLNQSKRRSRRASSDPPADNPTQARTLRYEERQRSCAGIR
jgi:hypothetical protein